MIGPGSLVEALRHGGHDSQGRPAQRPVAGRRYIVVETYEMKYGLGCALEGMDPSPYLGYFLFIKGNGKRAGWYFKEIDIADDIITAALRSLGEGVP